jgi:hypothetical protein
MKTTYILSLLLVITLATTSCEDVSDMAVNKVAAPVLVAVKNTSAAEVTAYFYELDKTGILDHTVGIDSIPVADLEVEVFAANASVGLFTTSSDGSISISYTASKPNEYAGVHKGVAFRIKK